MEIHPPEHPIFTWKQFFIHMSTICLGLLIAIGLEQTVEFVHHRHQRHQLEKDLRAEGIRNLHIAVDGFERLELLRRWQTQQALELDQAETEGRKPAYIQLPPMPQGRIISPSDAVWTVAQTSGMLGLLPRSEAERFAHPYFNLKLVQESIEKDNAVIADRREVLVAASSDPMAISPAQSTFDLSRLTKANLARFREVTGRWEACIQLGIGYELNLYALTWGTLQGHGDEENSRLMTEIRNTFSSGGAGAVLKKYPIPEENSAATEEDK
jgi:hypothetical protein